MKYHILNSLLLLQRLSLPLLRTIILVYLSVLLNLTNTRRQFVITMEQSLQLTPLSHLVENQLKTVLL